jgi:hypothetical protein
MDPRLRVVGDPVDDVLDLHDACAAQGFPYTTSW